MYIRRVPKLIDHQRRATDLTEAAWRVLVRGGVRAVSVRSVAAEAGLATASLRRAFPTQASLLAACLGLVRDRVTARVRALPRDRGPLEWSVGALAETLPLDQRRRLEMEVYLTLGTAALTDQRLAAAYRQVSGDLLHLCDRVIDTLLANHPPERRHREAAHLYALVDGLALHTLHGDDPTQALDILQAHLSGLNHG